MAWNLDRILSIGRQVARVVQDVQRTQGGSQSQRSTGPSRGGSQSGSHSRSRTSTAPRPGGQRTKSSDQQGRGGVGPEGEVLDYPGDFHGPATVEYDPIPGPDAGPGEVVWTWVPFEELDGRGKDRPVLILGRQGHYLLAAQLTSRDRNNLHSTDSDYLDIGPGDWDSKGRPSEVKLDRILQINPRDVRREGGVLDERIFGRVAQAMREGNGWS